MDRYLEWHILDANLKRLKKEEADLRRKLCADLFEGRQGNFKAIEEHDGIKVTATSKTTTKLDVEAYNQIHGELTQEDKNCVEFKPTLKKRDYNKLSEDSLLHEAIVEKPAMPTLKVEYIGEKGENNE